MTTTLTILFLAIALAGLASVIALRFARLQRHTLVGAAALARWAPVAATGLYLAVLAVNLSPGAPLNGHDLNLSGVFSTVEIIVLFLIGPLFLTRMGNVLAVATVAYSIERLLAGAAWTPNVALFIVSGSATTVAMLGDKMPWLQAEGSQILAYKVREIVLIALTTAALGVLGVGMLKAHALSIWVGELFKLQISYVAIMAAIAATFVGWLTVALDSTRRFAVAILALPTLVVLAYVTEWPSTLLIIPFALCLALSLTHGERRPRSRRRTAGASSTVVFFR